ncbi:MAG: ADP-forming succinate--CoA ligase subunit beta, partial [Myxococcota bacterium]|nr:ADP-forming succinate--CoA ligase subunit beta [Myxococcota bacterium]
MKVHEFQAKEILARHGVAVPPGAAVTSVDQAVQSAEEMGGGFWVVKAQVHAGGRGKGRFREVSSPEVLQAVVRGEADQPGVGGVALCRNLDEVRGAAQAMIGNTLVTKQTGLEGVRVETLYVTPGADIAAEFYAAVLLDRSRSRVVVMVSSEGGTEIEEVAATNPGAIHKVWADPVTGLGDWQARQLAFKLGLKGSALKGGIKLLKGLYATYVQSDATMAEVNPMIVTTDNQVLALDAKMSFDDNALFRHRDIAAMDDPAEQDPSEMEAKEHGLNFIKLDGNIGCLVNGAGLAMATMDIIKYYGAEPANFLDVGGGATTEQVTNAFKLITRDPSVKAIMVNIFGGIMKCDVIAEGVVAACREVGLQV